MKIKVEQLQLITRALFFKLAENNIEVIDVKSDYYWNILDENIYNPYEKPDNFTLGQLTDDWQELLHVINGLREPIPYDLQRMSNILKAIGIENRILF